MSRPVTVMTKGELASALRIGVSTIDRLRAEGLIRAFKVRTQVRFVYEDVLDDLYRAKENEGLRRLAAGFIKSGGPRRPEKQPSLRDPRRRDIVVAYKEATEEEE